MCPWPCGNRPYMGGFLERWTPGPASTTHWICILTRCPGDFSARCNPRVRGLSGSPKGWESVELFRVTLPQNPAVSALPPVSTRPFHGASLCSHSRPFLYKWLLTCCSTLPEVPCSSSLLNQTLVFQDCFRIWKESQHCMSSDTCCLNHTMKAFVWCQLSSDLPLANLASQIKWPVHQGQCSCGLNHNHILETLDEFTSTGLSTSYSLGF